MGISGVLVLRWFLAFYVHLGGYGVRLLQGKEQDLLNGTFVGLLVCALACTHGKQHLHTAIDTYIRARAHSGGLLVQVRLCLFVVSPVKSAKVAVAIQGDLAAESDLTVSLSALEEPHFHAPRYFG